MSLKVESHHVGHDTSPYSGAVESRRLSFAYRCKFCQLGDGTGPWPLIAIAKTVERSTIRQQGHKVAAIAAHEGNPEIAGKLRKFLRAEITAPEPVCIPPGT